MTAGNWKSELMKPRGVYAKEDIYVREFVCEYCCISYPAKEKTKTKIPALATQRDPTSSKQGYQTVGGYASMPRRTVHSFGVLIYHAPDGAANIRPHRPLMIGEEWRVSFYAIPINSVKGQRDTS